MTYKGWTISREGKCWIGTDANGTRIRECTEELLKARIDQDAIMKNLGG